MNRSKTFLLAGAFFLFSSIPSLADGSSRYKRIISLAPSITEILFSLGLEKNVVGVTRYCDYPLEAKKIRNVGGYLDPNYEAMIVLRPDLIITLPEHKNLEENMKGLRYEKLLIDNKVIQQILDSIQRVGEKCGVGKKASKKVEDLSRRMEQVKLKAKSLKKRPRVLVSVGRNLGRGGIKDAYIAGKGTFYDEMISLVGGVNAYEGGVSFPTVSPEGIIRMNPDVIIDIVPDLKDKKWSAEQVRKDWDSLFGIQAVLKDNVFVFGEDYTVIPGPRFILILEHMMKAVHSTL